MHMRSPHSATGHRVGRTGILVCLALAGAAYAAEGPTATQPASSQPADSQEIALKPAEVKPAAAPYNLLTTSRLTGDWGGARTALEDVGVSVAPLLFAGYVQNYHGGVATRHAVQVPGLMQYNNELDFGKMHLIPGGSFFIRAIQSWDDGIKPYVGSLGQPQWVWGSNGDHEILVDKWWYRQRLFDDRIEIRLGKLLTAVDLFDTNAYAGNNYSQFSNINLATNGAMPVSKGIGAFLKVWPTDWLYAQVGAMDPDQKLTRTGFDTAFHGSAHFRGYGEIGLTPKFDSPKGKLPGNYRFGTWYDPQTKVIFRDSLQGTRHVEDASGDVGFYTNFDQLVWKENENPKDKQGLGAFFRYGHAERDVNKVSDFWSVGTQYQGLLPSRDRDVLAFGVAQSIMSSQYRHEINDHADRETVYEMYYAIEVTPWCIITPDLQVITNPGGNDNARDALVGGLRMKIAF
jgi:porin